MTHCISHKPPAYYPNSLDVSVSRMEMQWTATEFIEHKVYTTRWHQTLSGKRDEYHRTDVRSENHGRRVLFGSPSTNHINLREIAVVMINECRIVVGGCMLSVKACIVNGVNSVSAPWQEPSTRADAIHSADSRRQAALFPVRCHDIIHSSYRVGAEEDMIHDEAKIGTSELCQSSGQTGVTGPSSTHHGIICRAEWCA